MSKESRVPPERIREAMERIPSEVLANRDLAGVKFVSFYILAPGACLLRTTAGAAGDPPPLDGNDWLAVLATVMRVLDDFVDKTIPDASSPESLAQLTKLKQAIDRAAKDFNLRCASPDEVAAAGN